MQAESGIIKIGCSRNPEKRRSSVQTKAKQKVSLLEYYPSDDMFLDESNIHKIFRKHTILGENGFSTEWFNISFKQTFIITRYFDRKRKAKSAINLEALLGVSA